MNRSSLDKGPRAFPPSKYLLLISFFYSFWSLLKTRRETQVVSLHRAQNCPGPEEKRGFPCFPFSRLERFFGASYSDFTFCLPAKQLPSLPGRKVSERRGHVLQIFDSFKDLALEKCSINVSGGEAPGLGGWRAWGWAAWFSVWGEIIESCWTSVSLSVKWVEVGVIITGIAYFLRLLGCPNEIEQRVAEWVWDDVDLRQLGGTKVLWLPSPSISATTTLLHGWRASSIQPLPLELHTFCYLYSPPLHALALAALLNLRRI